MDLERIAWQEEALPALVPVRGYPRPEPTAKTTPAPLPELADGEWIATVTLEDAGSTLNVREAPSTGARVLEKLAQGRQVIVCGEPDPDGWTKIRTAEIEGYCLAEYLN